MRYRDARLLKEGDLVVSKESQTTYKVTSIELYGSVKTVTIYCTTLEGDAKLTLFNTEVE